MHPSNGFEARDAPASPTGQAPLVKPEEQYPLTLAVTISSLGLNALSVLIQARLMGSAARGEIAAVMNLTLAAYIIGSVGLTSAAGYFAGKSPSEAGQVAVTLSSVLFVLSIPIVALLNLLAPVILAAQTAHVVFLARVFLAAVPLQFVGNVWVGCLQGVGALKQWNYLRALAPLSFLAISLYAARVKGDPVTIVVLGYLGFLLAITALDAIVVFRVLRPPFRFRFSEMRDMLRYGIQAGLTTLPAHLNLRMDQLLMGAFVSPVVLGVYSVCVAWASLIASVFASMGQVLFPRLIALDRHGEGLVLLKARLRTTLAFGLSLGAVMMAITPWALPLAFGAYYAAAWGLALVLLVANAVLGVDQMLGDGFRGLGKPGIPMLAEGLALGVTLALLPPLIRAQGALGAAVASLVAYSISGVVLVASLARLSNSGVLGLIAPDFSFLRRARAKGNA